MRNNKGITIIALVVTVIVLLILTGSIVQNLTKEDEIIKESKEAERSAEIKGLEEQIDIAILQVEQENDEPTVEKIIEKLIKWDVIENAESVDLDTGDITTKELEDRPSYVIKDKLNMYQDITFYYYNYLNYWWFENDEENYIEENKEKFKAKKGMTWEQWLKSTYNDSLYYNFEDDNSIIIGHYMDSSIFSKKLTRVEGDSLVTVFKDDLIIGEQTYVKNRTVAECVFPDSNILISLNGETELAEEITEGRQIAYYDFKTAEIKLGVVEKAYIHEKATNFVRYTFEDGTYLEATDYHPIYTKQGWKSYTRRNGYEKPEIGDEAKAEAGWKKITKIEAWEGLEDCYDFQVITKDGEKINNYFANGVLVQGSY